MSAFACGFTVGLGLDFMHQQQEVPYSSLTEHLARTAEAREQIEIMQESCTAAVAILNSLLQYESLTTDETLHLNVTPACAADFLREALRPAYVMVGTV
jgi:signal transduction histidine kinase